jgi:hypothetical protein
MSRLRAFYDRHYSLTVVLGVLLASAFTLAVLLMARERFQEDTEAGGTSAVGDPPGP